MSARRFRFTPAVLLLLALLPAAVAAQSGSIAGRVTSAESGAPLPGTRVEAIGADGRSITGSLADAQGRYRLTGLPAGTYSVSATLIGYRAGQITGVQLGAGEAVTVAPIALLPEAVVLNPVVITAGRNPEKALDAPAHVEVIGQQQVQARPTASIAEHLQGAAGLSTITQGIGAANISARGFNNIFSGSLHLITDNRIAAVPSLRVNAYSMIPVDQEDIGRIEVVLGPASALYGPNTANGVVHMITRSPLDHQGSVVSLGAGERSVVTGSFRTAQRVSENVGIKLSGRYLQGEEWHRSDPLEITARDYDLQQYAFDARADWRFLPSATAIFSAGRSTVDGVEMTGIGASQVRGWTSAYYQGRLNWNRLFAQAYLNTSDAGETFNLRDNLAIVDHSKLFVAQLQHGFDLGDRQTFTYGADLFRTMPDTRGTIHGVNEEDDNLTEIGVYLQSETALHPMLDLVLAGRVDDHSELQDQVFSPRAGLVFKPAQNQSFRITYNRAFSTPGSLNYFLDINSGRLPAPLGTLGYGARLQGNRGGWSFRDASGTYTMRSPFTPASLGGPAAAYAVNPVILYQMAVGVLEASGQIDAGTAQRLRQLNASGVGLMAMSLLDPQNPRPLTAQSVPDIAPLTESTNRTFEVGYKGILGERLLLAADVWRSKIDNFISGVELSSSMLLLNGPDLVQMFMAAGMSQQQATALATGMAQIPLGVISPEKMSLTAGQTDVLLTYQNFGAVELWGADLSLTALLSDHFSLGVTGSFTSDDRFDTDNRTIYLNAPTKRFTTSLGYRNEDSGLNGELRVRYSDGFPASSGVHIATRCVEPNRVGSEDCIESYSLVDVVLGYRVPGLRGTSIQLSVTNLLDDEYRSFAGVPEVGRLALIRLRREF